MEFPEGALGFQGGELGDADALNGLGFTEGHVSPVAEGERGLVDCLRYLRWLGALDCGEGAGEAGDGAGEAGDEAAGFGYRAWCEKKTYWSL